MPVDDLSVRAEQPGDAASIRAVVVAAFPTDGEARLVDALRSRGELLASLVAESGGQVVGHIAFRALSELAFRSGLSSRPAALSACIDGWQPACFGLRAAGPDACAGPER